MGSLCCCYNQATPPVRQVDRPTLYRISLLELKAKMANRDNSLAMNIIPYASNYFHERQFCATCVSFHRTVVEVSDVFRESNTIIGKHLEIVHIPARCELAFTEHQYRLMNQSIDQTQTV